MPSMAAPDDAAPPPAAAAGPTIASTVLRHPTDWLTSVLVSWIVPLSTYFTSLAFWVVPVLMGARSWGGEVGSGNGYRLVDCGTIFIPNYGAWSPKDGWIIEGRSVVPDIDLEQDPAALLAGRDPQLDRAIGYITEQAAKQAVEHPVPPAHSPVRVEK